MEVELFCSYFTLQCDLESAGRAWAYLNEFMCIGKNRNGYFVCLTASIPLELEVGDGGATLTVVREEDLFAGRRPCAQSILQFTLKHWKDHASLSLTRSTTGCLLLPNMARPELLEDREGLRDLVKRALPEVRAQWHVTSLQKHLSTVQASDKKEIERKENFPNGWLLLFAGVLSFSSASLETNLYTRETLEFDFDLRALLQDSERFSEGSVVQRIPLKGRSGIAGLEGITDLYTNSSGLALRVEVEADLSQALLILRVSWNNGAKGRSHKEIRARITSDHVSVEAPAPRQYMEVDRIVLSLEEEENSLINLIISGEELSDELAQVFDRESGVSVRLDRFLSRR